MNQIVTVCSGNICYLNHYCNKTPADHLLALVFGVGSCFPIRIFFLQQKSHQMCRDGENNFCPSSVSVYSGAPFKNLFFPAECFNASLTCLSLRDKK